MEHDLDPPFEDDEGFRLELESDDGNELHTKGAYYSGTHCLAIGALIWLLGHSYP